MARNFKILVITFLFSKAVSADQCEFPVAPEVIKKGKHELHQVWTFGDRPIFWSKKLPKSRALSNFRNGVKKRVGSIDPYLLLKRQYSDFIKSQNPIFLAEAKNVKLAMEKKAGRIRPISCTEALLLSLQAERVPMIENPTEFGAFILKKKIEKESIVKIYFSTIDRAGVRLPKKIYTLVDIDLSDGWTLWGHLHNHNFDFESKVSVIGGPSPSLNDVHFYRNQKGRLLKSAMVTNGFSTIFIPSNDFHIFDGVD